MELTPEEKFNSEPPERMMRRMLLEGFDRDAIVKSLIDLDWSPEEAAYQVDSYLARIEGRPPPPRPAASRHTPGAITVLCALGFAGVAMTLLTLSSPARWETHPGAALILLISVIIKTVCYLGLLKMRQWAVVVYAVFFLALQVPFWLSGYWNPESCLYSLALLAAGRAYWSHMKQ